MTGRPFPHLIADGLWPDELLDRVEAEFPAPDDARWRTYRGPREAGKQEGPQPLWGPATGDLVARLHHPDWIARLEEATGIEGLIPKVTGGGMHQVPAGGRLDLHADFNVDPDTGLYRRVNVLVYLNRGWTLASGGLLELGAAGDPDRVEVLPVFGRTVVFVCSDRSFHGHPRPVAEGRVRRSVAVYYFTVSPPVGFSGCHSTVWAS